MVNGDIRVKFWDGGLSVIVNLIDELEKLEGGRGTRRGS
jgi:hypothetical protein